MTSKHLYARLARFAMLSITLGLLAGCGSLQENVVQQAAMDQQTCQLDTPVGSSIARKRCVTPMTQEEKEAMRRDITRASGVHMCPAGGC